MNISRHPQRNGNMFDTKGLIFTMSVFVVVMGTSLSLHTILTYGHQWHWVRAFSAFVHNEEIAAVPQRNATDNDVHRSIASTPAPVFHLGFVGDIMLDRGVRQVIESVGNEYGYPFVHVRDALRGYDILFGNLEGPISDSGADTGKAYSFRMAPQALDALSDAGFDALSVANNHIGDWGHAALVDTLDRLRDVGISTVGGGSSRTRALSPRLHTLSDGTIVAFVGFSEFGSGYLEAKNGISGIAIAREEDVRIAVARAAQEADIVITSFHYGEEYALAPSDFQIEISRTAIDSGADVVVGHHPHVVQSLEKYGDGWIAYSLGNFVFDQNFSEETMRGGLLEVEIQGKRITGVDLRPVYINQSFQPQLPYSTGERE